MFCVSWFNFTYLLIKKRKINIKMLVCLEHLGFLR
jgi:hypothetical protein